MGIGDFFRRNQPGKNHGGQASQNTGGNKHGRSNNAAKKIKKQKKPKGK